MKSQHWNAASIAALVLSVAGFVGAMFFGEYATSAGFVQIPVQQPEFFICQMAMIGFLVLAALCYFGGNGATRREAQEARRKARQERQAERFARETSFINPQDFKEEV